MRGVVGEGDGGGDVLLVGRITCQSKMWEQSSQRESGRDSVNRSQDVILNTASSRRK